VSDPESKSGDSRRSYGQLCGLAKALDVVGERWTLLVVRNLLLGPLRYSDLLRGLPGITTNLLAKRLREMEAHGLVERVRAARGDTGAAYRLTDLGQGLEPAIHALGRWGFQRMAAPAPGDRRDLEWLLVALRRRYRGGRTMGAELLADGVPYRITLTPERVETARGPASAPDLRVRGAAEAIAPLFLAGIPAGGLPAGVEVDGGEERLRALLDAFARGEPAVAGPR
jgi:DNA-binding HxlR family transcriptional regulator